MMLVNDISLFALHGHELLAGCSDHEPSDSEPCHKEHALILLLLLSCLDSCFLQILFGNYLGFT